MRAIFFDLDNTLYDQRQYLEHAFRGVANYLNERFVAGGKNIENILWKILREKGSLYGHLFDDFVKYFAIDDDQVPDLIRVFHNPPSLTLSLYDDIAAVLPRLGKKYTLGIITNGNHEMQKRKVRALNIGAHVPIIFYTDEEGYPKPDPYCFMKAIKLIRCDPAETVYIGDNPHIDFPGAKQAGMRTLQYRRREFNKTAATTEIVDGIFDNYHDITERLKHF